MAEQLMTPRQVQAEYGIAPQTLANYRWQGLGPAYVKTTPGKSGRIKYRRSAVESWLDAQTVQAGGKAA
ncbi:helix-turn-helix domain-containing protein [Streptomyces kunmingensis]|uniref:Helix-turn-helix domain-containing protein n=1 Tax=Streptomyces kunmingensis TaxID=68225 RepID=A0ABU6CNE9_9ACTN|nr:helix-turn-helix domain-containing protein [Streptomyces kunmingensis]MEB3966253.1 helix-turn-helix domain-containing protein [Streptomyces kunmingensis]